MNLQYQYPQALWLLALIPFLALLFFLQWRWRKRTIKRIGDTRLVLALTKNHSPQRAVVKYLLFVFAFTLGCIALANPRQHDDAAIEMRRGIDVVIALDVSNSMLATDVKPDRLTAAQKLLTELIDKMPNDRIGLVIFAGNAYTQMPLSHDHEAAKLFVTSAHPNMVPNQGTTIADALLQSDAAFEENDMRFKTIILVTDGETHDEDAPEIAGQLAKKGVMVNTVGLGSPSGATIIDSAGKPKTNDMGEVVISKLNEKLLQQIATVTNGEYFLLNNMATTQRLLLEQYKDVDRKALPDAAGIHYESFYWWLLFPMFILLLTELFLPDRKTIKE